MIICLFPNEKKILTIELAQGIGKYLEEKGCTVVVEDDKSALIGYPPLSSVKDKNVKFFISMGGDGTILRLSHRYSNYNAAILGINLGQLGFMADIPITDVFPSLEDLISGEYVIEDRLIIETNISNNKTIYSANDLVAHRGANNSLIELSIYVDDIYFNSFLADGIIFATPNGSTAYSLSAGGPILSPGLDTFVITPISPHAISNRPFVLAAEHEIKVQYLSKYEHPIEIHADGIEHCKINTNEIFKLNKSKRKFRLVKLNRHDYFSTLRTKLGWSGKMHY
jgi:NAD+ kinase